MNYLVTPKCGGYGLIRYDIAAGQGQVLVEDGTWREFDGYDTWPEDAATVSTYRVKPI